MPDTLTLPNARSSYVATGPGWNRQLIHATAVAELPTTAMQTGDITWLMHVPAGAVIVDGYVAVDDIDSGTSVVYNIGTEATSTLFFSSTTTGQSAGSSAMATGTRYTKFADATRIKMTIVTTAQTPVAGTLIFGLSYFVDPELNVTTGVAPITA